jgi:hypothetical protein
MEDLVEGFIKQTGAEYYKEMYITDIEKKWGVDLSAISAEGTTTKRWDFVVKTDKTIYVIETNFYGDGGSKLNETARSYHRELRTVILNSLLCRRDYLYPSTLQDPLLLRRNFM